MHRQSQSRHQNARLAAHVRNSALILSTILRQPRAETAGAHEARFHLNIGITEEFLAATLPDRGPLKEIR